MGSSSTEPDESAGVKDKFREALERKRSRQAERNSAETRDQSKIQGAHGPEGGRRQFRRKSG
jgi:hypothetical protein